MIRKPNDSEISQCAILIYLSGPELFSYLYNVNEPEIYRLIEILCSHPSTAFSIKNAFVHLEEDILTGIVVALPVSDLKKSAKHELKCFFRFKEGILQSFAYILKSIFRLALVWYYPKLNKDEFFISNIAVFDNFRGKGIASQLLQKMELEAKKRLSKKLSLFVETDNSIAIGVYEKYGFYTESTSMLPVKYHRYGLKGFSKMVKNIHY